MKVKLICLLLCSLAILKNDAYSQILESIDFTPILGTAWGNSVVRLNIENHGLATVTFTPINEGSWIGPGRPVTVGPYNYAPYSSYSGPTELSDGTIFSPSQEVFFSTIPSSQTGLAGFNMTVTLDEGTFAEGSVFSARSFGKTGSNSQYLQIVSGLLSPDVTQLPTDGATGQKLILIDPAQQLYGPDSDLGASAGLAYGIDGGSFSVNFLTTQGYQPGGQAFTIAAPVPEPSAMFLVALSGVALTLRRRSR